MNPEKNFFLDYLKRRGLRHTRERQAIVREVLSSATHFDIDEIFIRLKKKTGVSKASIYRTIPLLIDAGLITEVYLEDGHMHYEPVYGRDRHCHLRCTKCRRFIEVTDPRLFEIEREIAELHGFKTEGHKMDILGLCPECHHPAK